MTQEQIEELDKLRYRISRLNNLILALNSGNDSHDISMNHEDKLYIFNYANEKIHQLKNKIELL